MGDFGEVRTAWHSKRTAWHIKRVKERYGKTFRPLAWLLSAIFVYLNNSKNSASREWGISSNDFIG
jgi:hypothetical protein